MNRRTTAIAALSLTVPAVNAGAPLCDSLEPTELISPSAGGYARAGFSVAAGGDIAVVGAYGDETQVIGGGSVTVYRLTAGEWTEEVQLLPPAPNVGDWFGYSVATDGVRIVVGVPYGAAQGVPRAGHVLMYRHDASLGWELEAELSNPVFQDRFGSSVDIDADRIIVGAPGRDFIAEDAGGADIFVFQNGLWQFERDVILNSLVAFSNAGQSVAIDLPHAIVGAPRDDSLDGNPLGGAAYAIELSETGWSNPIQLDAIDPFANGGFGGSIALDQGRAVIGSPDAPWSVFDSAGFATAFEFDNGSWQQTQRLFPPFGPWDADRFGDAMGMEGDRLVIGSPGRGYLVGYTLTSAGWQVATPSMFAPDNLQTRSFFGTAVGVSQHAVLIGADSTDVPGTNAGSAFLYRAACPCPADLAEPAGTLNFFDIVAFVDLYNKGDPGADLAEPFGSLNFFDVAAYIDQYNAGCP